MFEAFLNEHDSSAWARALEALAPAIHEVDRDATRIWRHFFPLSFGQAVARTTDPTGFERALFLEGRYRLADQCDSSHWFLYGHRYWPHVKTAIVKRADTSSTQPGKDLADVVREVAKDAAAAAGEREQSLVVGIAAVGLMTLQQVGLTEFRRDTGGEHAPSGLLSKSPSKIVAARKRDDGQGVFGMFRGVHKVYTARFDERQPDATFKVIHNQHLTTAAATDTRDYSSGPRRCHEGPIPIRCRSASCGSCWIGVLGGADKLTAVEPLEARRMQEFGYIQTMEPNPIVRLACMARPSGNVTFVIPPWNGIIGKAGLGAEQ